MTALAARGFSVPCHIQEIIGVKNPNWQEGWQRRIFTLISVAGGQRTQPRDLLVTGQWFELLCSLPSPTTF